MKIFENRYMNFIDFSVNNNRSDDTGLRANLEVCFGDYLLLFVWHPKDVYV